MSDACRYTDALVAVACPRPARYRVTEDGAVYRSDAGEWCHFHALKVAVEAFGSLEVR